MIVFFASGLDLILVAFVEGETYFSEIVSSSLREVIQSSSYVRVIYLWHKSFYENVRLTTEQEFKQCHVAWERWVG